MNPERWRQVDRLLEEALDLPPAEHAAFLDRACAGDDELRRDIEAVLGAHGKAGSFLSEPVMAGAAKQMVADQTKSLAGRILEGHYEVIALIGAGGMGEVYRAKDTRLGREVAIKVLPEHLAQNNDALARFEREAKAVAALSHPNILAIHDLGAEQGIHYAVMELLEGETLRGRLSRAPLPWREAVEIAAAIADGLAAAHVKGIIHRDLKPENIFLTGDGRIKILDFGLARRKPSVSVPSAGSTPAVTAVTEPWMVMGTVGYMSPEQVRGEEADAPSDIFSLGCVLYEMATGRRAFARATSAEMMAAIVRDEPSGLNESVQNLPPELQQLIHRCLNKEPVARYQSARDLFYDLSALLSRSGIFRASSAQQRGVSKRGSRIVAIVTVLVLTLALGYVAVDLWKPAPSAPKIAGQRLIATLSGSNSSASFSPNGDMIAFVKPADGIPQIWVKSLSEGDPHQITFGDVPAHRPKWSPKGDQILFNKGGIGQDGAVSFVRDLNIWTVPPLGGTARMIIEGGSNPNFSGDGNQFVFEKGLEIWTARADGSDQRKVEGVPHTDYLLSDRMPALSPDGSRIAFFQPEAGPLGDFWVIPSTGGQARQLTFDVTAGGSPAWTPDGNFVLFSSERDGSMTLWSVGAEGITPEPLTIGAGEDTDAVISRDGKSLVYTHTRLSRTLSVLNPSTQKTRELRQWQNQLALPTFSPDGKKIAFFSHESGGEIHLSTIDSDGSDLTRVTWGKGERNAVPQWSSDGKTLYFYQTRPTTSFRKISVGGGPSSEVVNGWKMENFAKVDPTGKRAVYGRMRNSLSVATVIHDLESGKEFDLQRALFSPRWSGDGKFIVGVQRPLGTRDGDIYICPPDSGACEKLTTGYLPVWSNDTSTVYFLRAGRILDGAELWIISLKTRNETYITDLRPMYPIGHPFDVSPQGEIVFVRFDSGDHELWLADLSAP